MGSRSSIRGAQVVIALSLLIPGLADAWIRPAFYRFGLKEGDAQLPLGDDLSVAVQLSTLFPFFNMTFDKVYINNNGFLSFEREMPDYNQNLYKTSSHKMIAAYLSDVDTTGGAAGAVWFRETTFKKALRRASLDVKTHFDGHPEFGATHMLVVTWDRVAAWREEKGGHCEGCDARNTFQIVYVSDGRDAFVFFHYEGDELENGLEWTASDAKPGIRRLVPALVGFYAPGIRPGSRWKPRSFTLPGSGTSVVNRMLWRRSNVGVPGRFLFHVNHSPPQEIFEGHANDDPVPFVLRPPPKGSDNSGSAGQSGESSAVASPDRNGDGEVDYIEKEYDYSKADDFEDAVVDGGDWGSGGEEDDGDYLGFKAEESPETNAVEVHGTRGGATDRTSGNDRQNPGNSFFRNIGTTRYRASEGGVTSSWKVGPYSRDHVEIQRGSEKSEAGFSNIGNVIIRRPGLATPKQRSNSLVIPSISSPTAAGPIGPTVYQWKNRPTARSFKKPQKRWPASLYLTTARTTTTTEFVTTPKSTPTRRTEFPSRISFNGNSIIGGDENEAPLIPPPILPPVPPNSFENEVWPKPEYDDYDLIGFGDPGSQYRSIENEAFERVDEEEDDANLDYDVTSHVTFPTHPPYLPTRPPHREVDLHGEGVDRIGWENSVGWGSQGGNSFDGATGTGLKCGNHICDNNAKCLFESGLNRAMCVCDRGFVGDGSTCQLDPQPLDRCVGAACICPPGTTGVQPFCRPVPVPADLCNGATCKCPPGMSGVQPFCEPEPTWAPPQPTAYEPRGPQCGETFCHPNARCIAKVIERGSEHGMFLTKGPMHYKPGAMKPIRVCLCRYGYFGNGIHCSKTPQSCDTLSCHPYARCIFDDNKNEAACHCIPGYVGDGKVCDFADLTAAPTLAPQTPRETPPPPRVTAPVTAPPPPRKRVPHQSHTHHNPHWSHHHVQGGRYGTYRLLPKNWQEIKSRARMSTQQRQHDGRQEHRREGRRRRHGLFTWLNRKR